MELRDLQRNWDAFGKSDPLWSILSEPAKRGNRWDVGEFFRTGEVAIRGLMVESCGGQLLQTAEGGSAGPEWESYLYYYARRR